MRFVVTNYAPRLYPVPNTDKHNPYQKWELDSQGNVKFRLIMVPVGHWIGPGVRSYKQSHPGKPREYYQRKNTPKHLRASA